MDKIKQLGSNIRKQFAAYQSYTRNAPLIMYGKENIITILDREDHIIASRKMVHTTPNKQQQQQQQQQPTEKPARMHCSSTNTPKKRQSSPSSSSPIKQRSKSTTNTTTTTTTTTATKSTLQMISRPTLTFMAKCKEKRTVNNGPGSTLRLRNMLAKRNPALKMMNEQMMIGSTVC
ncbi:hypothetical protein MBANPS3_009011 [Mucor bainieri]